MELDELYRTCRSVRRFEQRPVPEKVLHEMLEHARLVSCASNKLPLRYIVVKSPDMVAAMQPLMKWAALLPPEIGAPKEDELPTAFVVVIQAAGAGAFRDVDTGIAVSAMTMTAWKEGVGSCILGSINVPKVRELLHIASADTPRLALALGYPKQTGYTVDVPVGADIKYYLDEQGCFVVPKYQMADIVRIV